MTFSPTKKSHQTTNPLTLDSTVAKISNHEPNPSRSGSIGACRVAVGFQTAIAQRRHFRCCRLLEHSLLSYVTESKTQNSRAKHKHNQTMSLNMSRGNAVHTVLFLCSLLIAKEAAGKNLEHNVPLIDDAKAAWNEHMKSRVPRRDRVPVHVDYLGKRECLNQRHIIYCENDMFYDL